MERGADQLVRASRAGVSALGVVAALLLVLAIAGAAFVVMFIRGTAGVDDWALRQVVAITNTYLVPEMDFETFDYTYPATLTLEGVSFTAPSGARVIDASALRVTLAERPRRGEPIRIQRVDLLSPTLHLIESREDGRLRFEGLVPFVDREPVREPSTVEETVRLSNVLRMQKVTLTDGALTYEPAGDDPPMRLTGLNLDLDVEPETEQTESGAIVWHRVDADINRAPIFDLAVDGRFSLDTLVAEIKDLSLDMRVAPDTLESLPPQLQTLLRDHDARGELSAHASGRFPVQAPTDAQLDVHGQVADFNVAVGEYRAPIEKGATTISLHEGRLSLSTLELDTLDGKITIRGEADLKASARPARLAWSVKGAELRELLRTAAPPDQPPRIAGVVNGDGEITGELTSLPRSLQGPGQIEISGGRLVFIPAVRALAAAMDALSQLTGGGALSDQFEANFHMEGQGVEVERFELTTPAIGAAGSGTIGYTGELDMVVSGGPVKRLTKLLGKVGNVLGEVTGGLVRYRVRGTVADPSVSVHALGVGAKRDRNEVTVADDDPDE